MGGISVNNNSGEVQINPTSYVVPVNDAAQAFMDSNIYNTYDDILRIQNEALDFGITVNFANTSLDLVGVDLEAGSAGLASGKWLVITLNGAALKIPLFLP